MHLSLTCSLIELCHRHSRQYEMQIGSWWLSESSSRSAKCSNGADDEYLKKSSLEGERNLSSCKYYECIRLRVSVQNTEPSDTQSSTFDKWVDVKFIAQLTRVRSPKEIVRSARNKQEQKWGFLVAEARSKPRTLNEVSSRAKCYYCPFPFFSF